jgi:hypothetical protein
VRHTPTFSIEDEMTEPAAATPPQDTASTAEDFVDIFLAPAKVFARRAKASPMVPFLVVCVIMSVLFFSSRNILSPIFDAQIAKQTAAQMKANPQITPEMIEKSKPITNVILTVGGIIGSPIILLFLAMILWIIGRFFMSSGLTYGTALLITSFTWFPRIIAGIVTLVEGLTMDVGKLTEPGQLAIAASRLVDPASMSTGMYTLLTNVDVFAIWGSVLCAIGLMYAGKLEKSKAITTAAIMFVLGCVPALWLLLTGK